MTASHSTLKSTNDFPLSLFVWYLTIKFLKLFEPTIFSSIYFISLKLMFSLLTFPIFLPFVLISLFSLFPGFGNLPLCSRLFVQIHYYYISEILLHNTFLPVKAHRVIMIYCPSPNKDESNDPTIISKLWVWIGCLVVKGGFSLMNLYCFH